MMGNDAGTSTRTLADIEADLIRAEQAFADADARYKTAQQDRRLALSTIDQHQDELDDCLLRMRQKSVAGTKWCRALEKGEEPLELHSDDMVSEAARASQAASGDGPSSAEKAAARSFDLLRASANAKADDPVLKVVSGPRS